MYAVLELRGRGRGHGNDGDDDGRESGNGPALQKIRLHRLQAS